MDNFWTQDTGHIRYIDIDTFHIEHKFKLQWNVKHPFKIQNNLVVNAIKTILTFYYSNDSLLWPQLA